MTLWDQGCSLALRLHVPVVIVLVGRRDLFSAAWSLAL